MRGSICHRELRWKLKITRSTIVQPPWIHFGFSSTLKRSVIWEQSGTGRKAGPVLTLPQSARQMYSYLGVSTNKQERNDKERSLALWNSGRPTSLPRGLTRLSQIRSASNKTEWASAAGRRTGSKDCVTTEFKVVGQHIEMAQDLNKCNNIQNRHKDEDMDTLIDNLNNRVLSWTRINS